MRSYNSSFAISGKVFLENERGPSIRVGLCRLVSPCLEVSDILGGIASIILQPGGSRLAAVECVIEFTSKKPAVLYVTVPDSVVSRG